MHRIDGLSKAQRVVVVIALGFALWAVGNYVVSVGSGGVGWTAFAPLTAQLTPYVRGLPDWLRLIIWLVLIGLWAVASIRLLRPEPENAAAGHPSND